MDEITGLLKAWSKGDRKALDKLIPLVDRELKKIAHKYMRNESREPSLQTTALVHEALIKLIQENISWKNRKQFYVFVARRMRQVLFDCAKKQSAAKRAGWGQQVDVIEVKDQSSEKSREIIKLEQALVELHQTHERAATIVECRFFIGLTLPEIAKLLGVAQSTVDRDWRFARGFLQREMTGDAATPKKQK
jgi:RNA polymerase sigma factor (TIGR02999 family)